MSSTIGSIFPFSKCSKFRNIWWDLTFIMYMLVLQLFTVWGKVFFLFRHWKAHLRYYSYKIIILFSLLLLNINRVVITYSLFSRCSYRSIKLLRDTVVDDVAFWCKRSRIRFQGRTQFRIFLFRYNQNLVRCVLRG